MTVFDQRSGVLFAGDLVFDQHVPALDDSLRGWQKVLTELTHQDFAYVVPGHGGLVLQWPDGAQPLRRYLATLASDTQKPWMQASGLAPQRNMWRALKPTIGTCLTRSSRAMPQ